MAAVVGPDRFLTMHVSVSLEKTGGDVSTVLVNSSNTELAPAMVSQSILAMFPVIASRHDVPSFTVKWLEFTISHIEDMGITDTHTFIAGLPRMYSLG